MTFAFSTLLHASTALGVLFELPLEWEMEFHKNLYKPQKNLKKIDVKTFSLGQKAFTQKHKPCPQVGRHTGTLIGSQVGPWQVLGHDSFVGVGNFNRTILERKIPSVLQHVPCVLL